VISYGILLCHPPCTTHIGYYQKRCTSHRVEQGGCLPSSPAAATARSRPLLSSGGTRKPDPPLLWQREVGDDTSSMAAWAADPAQCSQSQGPAAGRQIIELKLELEPCLFPSPSSSEGGGGERRAGKRGCARCTDEIHVALHPAPVAPPCLRRRRPRSPSFHCMRQRPPCRRPPSARSTPTPPRPMSSGTRSLAGTSSTSSPRGRKISGGGWGSTWDP
jgi:hypothetical protein